MSESSLRRTGSRPTRGSSRAPSARSSAYIPSDDRSHPLPHLPQHALRAAESRFSLHEQFAATRQEYEFGFDDSSSILERITTPSEAGLDGDHDKTLTAGFDAVGVNGEARPMRLVRRNFYELLCIPNDASLTQDAIRKAYYRLFYLLHAVEPPVSLQPAAKSYFEHVQEAFETLIEPYRRIDYDVSRDADGTWGSDLAAAEANAEVEVETMSTSENDVVTSYEESLQDRYLQFYQNKVGTTSDMAVRLDATGLLHRQPWPLQRGWPGLVPVDIALRQSTTVELAELSRLQERGMLFVQDALASRLQATESRQRLHCGTSTVTVSSSIQGFNNAALYTHAPLLLDHYNPPGLVFHGQPLVTRLWQRPFLPHVNVKLRQGLFWRDGKDVSTTVKPQDAGVPDVVVEIEGDFSPEPTIVYRMGRSIPVAGEEEPFHVELSVKAAPTATDFSTGVGLALHRRVSGGTAFMAVDGGDWTLWRSKTCSQFSKFYRALGSFGERSTVSLPPTVEVGYTFSSYEMGMSAGRAFTKPAERGIRGLDRDLEDDISGSWTVSAAATASNLAGYLRYGRDLLSGMGGGSQAAAVPPGNYSHRSSGIRAEVELSTSRVTEYFLAVRALKRLGKFSRLGLELGLTPYTLHVSVCWSRLGQRLSLPFLIAVKPNINTDMMFWSAVVPFVGLAAMEAFVWGPRSRTKRRSYDALTKEQLQEVIASRRNEADDLTALLAGAADQRQRSERERGGLVVLSAKYGVRDTTSPSGWAMEEVADVTIAVAALVDDGRLFIPEGLRKSHLLGFWDPSPLKTKVLSVSYTIGGKQQTAEVTGRAALRLP